MSNHTKGWKSAGNRDPCCLISARCAVELDWELVLAAKWRLLLAVVLSSELLASERAELEAGSSWEAPWCSLWREKEEEEDSLLLMIIIEFVADEEEAEESQVDEEHEFLSSPK